MHMRHLAATLFVLAFVGGSPPVPSSHQHSALGTFVAPTAEAKNLRERARSLLDRITGTSMPEGIVKTNGRIEAIQVDVAAKYPGRLVDITVEEGSEVKAGQVVGRVASPEYEAQLRAAQSNVDKAEQALAEAESLITQRKAVLAAAKSDFAPSRPSWRARRQPGHPGSPPSSLRSTPVRATPGPRGRAP